MARVTVEDCVEKVPNRFDLVLLAAHRARAMSAGEPITVERDNDKNPVVALREIADGGVKPELLREDYITSLQKYADTDEPEEDELSLLGTPDMPEENTMTEEELMSAIQGQTPPPRPRVEEYDEDE